MKQTKIVLKRIATNNWIWGAVAFGCLMTNHPTALVAVCSAIVVNLVLSARGGNVENTDELDFDFFDQQHKDLGKLGIYDLHFNGDGKKSGSCDDCH
jgi:hypothetical protein